MAKHSHFRLAALLAGALVATGPAAAGDEVFFERIDGVWSGPGEIVAGKYKGTRFSCTLKGESAGAKPGMTLDGTCRVGLFSQAISARVVRRGRSYGGQFLDGAGGKGLDVVSGNVSGDRVVLGMERAELSGAMVARVKPNGRLGVTVSVRVEDELVPVIGIDLERKLDGRAVGSVR